MIVDRQVEDRRERIEEERLGGPATFSVISGDSDRCFLGPSYVISSAIRALRVSSLKIHF